MANVIAKAWRTSEEVTVAAWGDNLYAFGFRAEDDVTKIMSSGPWSIMGCLMVLRKWDAQKTLEELDFNFSPFWVQIQGLPLGFLNARSGMKIAESLGEVIAVEDPDGRGKPMRFIRVRVWIDITKPLKKGFYLKRHDDEDIWVKFKYERLSDYCYGCGRVGHTVNDCGDKGGVRDNKWPFNDLRAETLWLDTIQFGDRKPVELIYPYNRGRVDRNKDSEGGACSSQAEKRVGGQKGLMVSTDDRGKYALGNIEADSGVGQVSMNEESTDGIQTNQPDSSSAVPLVNIPSSRNPNLFMKRAAISDVLPLSHRPNVMGQLYFVKEPDSPQGTPGSVDDLSRKPPSPSHRDVGLSHIFDRLLNLKRKHPGDHESEVSSKKQNLAIAWQGGPPNSEAREAAVSLPPHHGSITPGLKAHRRDSKNTAVKGSKRRGRKKAGIPLSNADSELVEVSVSQSPDFSNERVHCDVSVEEILSDGDSEGPLLSSRALVAGPKQPRDQW